MALDGFARLPPRDGARPGCRRCRPSSPLLTETLPALFHRAVFVNATASLERANGRSPRARTRPLSSLDVGREKSYLRCAGLLGLRADGMRAAPSRPARHDTRGRTGQAK